MSRKYGASFAEILAATNVTGEGGLTGRGGGRGEIVLADPENPNPVSSEGFEANRSMYLCSRLHVWKEVDDDVSAD